MDGSCGRTSRAACTCSEWPRLHLRSGCHRVARLPSHPCSAHACEAFAHRLHVACNALRTALPSRTQHMQTQLHNRQRVLYTGAGSPEGRHATVQLLTFSLSPSYPPRTRRTWVTQNFLKGLALCEKIAEVAEGEGHHPDLHLTGQMAGLGLWRDVGWGVTACESKACCAGCAEAEAAAQCLAQGLAGTAQPVLRNRRPAAMLPPSHRTLPCLPPLPPLCLNAGWNKLTVSLWTHARSGLTGEAVCFCPTLKFCVCATLA